MTKTFFNGTMRLYFDSQTGKWENTHDFSSGDNPKRKDFYLEHFSGYDTIMELGVARGDSSMIFLECARKVIGVDIEVPKLLQDLHEFAESVNSEYQFIHSNDLLIEPIPCDILFIDSNHQEEQTYLELKKFSSSVNTFIALHDVNPEYFQTIKGFNRWFSEEGNADWEEYYRDYDGCGLLVIKRKN